MMFFLLLYLQLEVGDYVVVSRFDSGQVDRPGMTSWGHAPDRVVVVTGTKDLFRPFQTLPEGSRGSPSRRRTTGTTDTENRPSLVSRPRSPGSNPEHP